LDPNTIARDRTGQHRKAFDALHRRRKATDAMLYAFDLLELNGEDMRSLPLVERKVKVARLLARAPNGIVFNEHTNEDGATVAAHGEAVRARR
jgi:ATP-dependent DNA ligase